MRIKKIIKNISNIVYFVGVYGLSKTRFSAKDDAERYLINMPWQLIKRLYYEVSYLDEMDGREAFSSYFPLIIQYVHEDEAQIVLNVLLEKGVIPVLKTSQVSNGELKVLADVLLEQPINIRVWIHKDTNYGGIQDVAALERYLLNAENYINLQGLDPGLQKTVDSLSRDMAATFPRKLNELLFALLVFDEGFSDRKAYSADLEYMEDVEQGRLHLNTIRFNETVTRGKSKSYKQLLHAFSEGQFSLNDYAGYSLVFQYYRFRQSGMLVEKIKYINQIYNDLIFVRKTIEYDLMGVELDV